MCTYLISWTYADKLHTFNCMIYFHNVRQHAHKKTSSKTGFTLVCYSFISIIFFFFEKVKQKFSCIFSCQNATRNPIRCKWSISAPAFCSTFFSIPKQRCFFKSIRSLLHCCCPLFQMEPIHTVHLWLLLRVLSHPNRLHGSLTKKTICGKKRACRICDKPF